MALGYPRLLAAACCIVFLTSNEIDFAMGWPTIRTSRNQEYARALQMETIRMFSDLDHAFVNENGRRQLAGNGMMLQQMFACLLQLIAFPLSSARVLPSEAQDIASDDDDA